MRGNARIHAILARDGASAVIFRRGPSKKTAVIGWNLKDDTFKVGQWFYGSFYPYRCDLSPDGRHLVYFAAKYGRNSWTAVSRAPYLKALALWFNGSGWNGGGLFVDNRRLALNHPPSSHGSAVRVGTCAFQEVPPPDSCKGWGYAGECPMVYVPRLLRDGWMMLSEDCEGWLFEKPLAKGLKLRKWFVAGRPGPNHGCYWERHAVVDATDKTTVDGTNWSWADYDRSRKRVVLAEGGVLSELRITGEDLKQAPLRDFNDMKSERLKAPY